LAKGWQSFASPFIYPFIFNGKTYIIIMKGVFMKKILLLFLFSLLFNLQFINAQPANFIVSAGDDNTVRKIDSSGNQIWSFTGHTADVNSVVVDSNGFIYSGSTDTTVRKIDSNGTQVWSFTGHTSFVFGVAVDNNGNVYSVGNDNTVRKINSSGTQVWSFTGHTDRIWDVAVDNNGNVYSSSRDGTVRKIDSSGNQIWVFSPSAGASQAVTVDDNGNVYAGFNDNTVRKINSSGTQVWSFTGHTNIINGVAVDNNGNVYSVGNDTTVRKIDSNGNQVWSFTGHTAQTMGVAVDLDGNVYSTSGGTDRSVRKINSSGTQVWSFTGHTARVQSVAVEKILPIEYPLQINLDSNYNPYADIVYTSDFLTTTSSIVNDILPSASSVVVSTNQSNISPFVFQHWYDLDNNNIYTTSRTFTITNPNINYNLRAIYDLTNSIDLSLDSTLPSPPNFNLEVDTIEQQRAIISQYPFINEEIPFGYNFEVEAPTDNVGVYQFDYWWNNSTNSVFTTSAIISLDAIQNYDLTATYSLPSEYQIVLTLFSNIGDITFKLGNQPAITGSFIEVTIGQGDSWTASGPLNPDFQFQYWIDFETNNIFSTNRSFGVSNTTQNYILEATYWPIYDVNWDSQGGTLIPSQRIVSGSSINAPSPNPLRPGFAFDGWALPSAPTTPVTFPQIINNNVTYQAIWLNTFELTFNTNGGQPIPNQIIIENNLPTVVTPSRFGYTFDGWFSDNVTFANPFNFNAPFNANTTIHAKWIFGTDRDVNTSLNQFLEDSSLDDPFSQWIIVLAVFIIINVLVFIYSGPMIVTVILNFILTAIFIIIGFIPIWVTIVIFLSIFGYMLLTLSGGRS
jgi:outer membrane protein assembly factor BamB